MKKIQVLDGTCLKIIAMICMLIDHVGATLFPNLLWMRIIGRISFPIFAFCISEGYIYTSNKKKYLLRLGLFAIISEIPFNLVVNNSLIYLEYQNVMFTFFASILSLLIYDYITNSKKSISYIIGLFIVLLISIITLILKFDYGAFGVSLVFIYYVFKDKSLLTRNIIGTIYQIISKNVGIYLYGALSFIPIFLYNGKKGKGLKWLFYIFYPGHLLLIYLIKVLIHL